MKHLILLVPRDTSPFPRAILFSIDLHHLPLGSIIDPIALKSKIIGYNTLAIGLNLAPTEAEMESIGMNEQPIGYFSPPPSKKWWPIGSFVTSLA